VLTYQVFKDTTDGTAPIVDTVVYVLENSKSKTGHEIEMLELNQALSIEDRWKQIQDRSWTKTYKKNVSAILEESGAKILLSNLTTLPGTAKTFPLEEGRNPAFLVRIGTQEYAVGKGIPRLSQKQVKDRIYHSETRTDRSFMPFIPCGDVQRFNLRWSETYLKWGGNLHCPREKGIFQAEHLVVSRIFDKKAGRLKVAYVPKGSDDRFFVNNTDSFNVVGSRNDEISLKFILGILNSKFIGDWLQNTNVNLKRAVYPKINTKDLKKIPIPFVTIEQQAAAVSKVEMLESIYSKKSPLSVEDKEELGLVESELEVLISGFYGADVAPKLQKSELKTVVVKKPTKKRKSA